MARQADGLFLRPPGYTERFGVSKELSRLIISFQDDVLVVEFADPRIVDDVAIAQIGHQLNSLLERRPGLRILVNFDGVQQMSSSALGFLVSFAKKLEAAGGQLKLCNIVPQIYQAFVITRLHRVFEVHDSTHAAFAAF